MYGSRCSAEWWWMIRTQHLDLASLVQLDPAQRLAGVRLLAAAGQLAADVQRQRLHLQRSVEQTSAIRLLEPGSDLAAE